MTSMTPQRAGWLAFAFMLTFNRAVMNLRDHSFYAWFALGRSGVTTTATITEVAPPHHAHCAFTYVVDGRTFSGHESGCAQYGIGGTLTLAYPPADPTFATSRDPYGHRGFAIFAPLALSIFAGIGAAIRVSECKTPAACAPMLDAARSAWATRAWRLSGNPRAFPDEHRAR